MTRADYHDHKETRIARFQDLAKKNQKTAEQLHDQAHKMAENIPFGQPILIGHHSEKRDRNYRDKIHRTFEKAFEASDKADHYRQKAAGAIDNTAISSDNPDALSELKAKLQNLKASHEMMLQGNKVIRDKKLSPAQKIEELIRIGLEPEKARTKLMPDCMGDIGFPRYAITNSGANIRNVEKRIEQMEKEKDEITTETMIGNISIIDSIEENRLMVIFPYKPDEPVRAYLKRSGFRWSPTRGAYLAFRSAKWKVPALIRFFTAMPAYIDPVQVPADVMV
jgi:hypothetical protein